MRWNPAFVTAAAVFIVVSCKPGGGVPGDRSWGVSVRRRILVAEADPECVRRLVQSDERLMKTAPIGGGYEFDCCGPRIGGSIGRDPSRSHNGMLVNVTLMNEEPSPEAAKAMCGVAIDLARALDRCGSFGPPNVQYDLGVGKACP
jgi:hypothetical protein